MHAVPTKRLFVYIAAGVVVLVVGTLGLVSMRGGGPGTEDGLVIDTGVSVQGLIGASGDAPSTGAGEGAGTGSGGGGTVGAVPAAEIPATTTTTPRIWVQVAGAVNRPGVYEMADGARVFEAVIQAGGFTEEADEEAIALAATLSDGCRIYVPRSDEAGTGIVETPVVSSAGITEAAPSGSGTDGVSPSGPVSLNSATLEQLDALPGIGPAIAQQIITYREMHGPFTAVDQLTDVPGIGQARLEQLRPLVGL